METALIVSILVSGILNLIMGVLIIVGGEDKKRSLPFALFSFATFLVALSYFAIHKTDFPDSVRWSYAFGVLIPTFLLSWVYNYSSENINVWKKVAIYAIGLVLFILPFADGLLIAGINKDARLGFVEVTGPLYPLYIAFYVIAYGIVLISLFEVYRKKPEERRQTRLILTGFGLYGALGILFGLMLPFFGYDRLTDLDIPSTVIFVGFTTYAIVQYRWMNIKVIAVELMSALILGVALFEVFLAGTAYQRIYKAVMFAVLSALTYFLVKGVLSEVRRKEELEVISKKLARANAKLKELDLARAEFMSFASHQLQTPLTAIRGYASLLLEGSDGELTTDQKDKVGKISSSSVRMVELVEDYLNLSRIESGRMEFTFEKWSLEDICQEVVSALELKAKEKGLSLTFHGPDTPLKRVTFDGPKIREVISNLVDNAIKYTQSGGVTVDIERRLRMAHEASDWLRVTVSDTGLGISKEELPQLFAKFNRGTDKERLKIKGTGLGLYVGKVIVEKHGGRIWAESDGDGKGSRFIVEIPAQ